MTEDQRTAVKEVWDEIKKLPGADTVEMNAEGFSVVRMTYIPKSKHYRMTNIGSGNDKAEIRKRMMQIFHDLMKAAGQEK